MPKENNSPVCSAIFLTFSGNCKPAFTLYQHCFGGTLGFDFFDKKIAGFDKLLVVRGQLKSKFFVFNGSDLVHNEGRIIGNNMAIYVHCKNQVERLNYIKLLQAQVQNCSPKKYAEQRLIEVVDKYDIRWVFGI